MEHAAAGILLGIILMALLVRYLYWTIDQEGARLARMESDTDFRREERARLDDRLAARPDDLRALRLRADILALDADWDGAARDLDHCLRLNAKDDTAWSELAEARMRLNQSREAVEAARRAVELDPDYIDYRAVLCRAQLLAEDLPAARSAWGAWQALARKLHEERATDAPRRLANWLPRLSPLENPYLHLHEAALLLAEGEAAAARDAFARASGSPHAPAPGDLAEDPVLSGLSRLPAAAVESL